MNCKIIFLLLAFLVIAGVLNAQQLTNVFINQNGKSAYRFAMNGVYLILNDIGKLTEIKTDAFGAIIYDNNKRVEQIGDMKIGFNYQNQVNNIGNYAILYDYSGRVDRIGNIIFKYNYKGMLVSVADNAILYNPNGSVDQFGDYKIHYNYNAQVQRIDESKGLILLQLNYFK